MNSLGLLAVTLGALSGGLGDVLIRFDANRLTLLTSWNLESHHPYKRLGFYLSTWVEPILVIIALSRIPACVASCFLGLRLIFNIAASKLLLAESLAKQHIVAFVAMLIGLLGVSSFGSQFFSLASFSTLSISLLLTSLLDYRWISFLLFHSVSLLVSIVLLAAAVRKYRSPTLEFSPHNKQRPHRQTLDFNDDRSPQQQQPQHQQQRNNQFASSSTSTTFTNATNSFKGPPSGISRQIGLPRATTDAAAAANPHESVSSTEPDNDGTVNSAPPTSAASTSLSSDYNLYDNDDEFYYRQSELQQQQKKQKHTRHSFFHKSKAKASYHQFPTSAVAADSCSATLDEPCKRNIGTAAATETVQMSRWLSSNGIVDSLTRCIVLLFNDSTVLLIGSSSAPGLMGAVSYLAADIVLKAVTFYGLATALTSLYLCLVALIGICSGLAFVVSLKILSDLYEASVVASISYSVLISFTVIGNFCLYIGERNNLPDETAGLTVLQLGMYLLSVLLVLWGFTIASRANLKEEESRLRSVAAELVQSAADIECAKAKKEDSAPIEIVAGDDIELRSYRLTGPEEQQAQQRPLTTSSSGKVSATVSTVMVNEDDDNEIELYMDELEETLKEMQAIRKPPPPPAAAAVAVMVSTVPMVSTAAAAPTVVTAS